MLPPNIDHQQRCLALIPILLVHMGLLLVLRDRPIGYAPAEKMFSILV